MVSILISVVSFIIYTSIIFLSANFETIKEGFMRMFTTHSQLRLRSITDIMSEIFKSSSGLIIFCLATSVSSLFSNRKLTSSLWFISIAMYIITIFLKCVADNFPPFNTEILWLAALGFTSMFIDRKKVNKELIIFMCFSFMYALIHGCLSSDTGIMAVSMDLLILIVPSILYIPIAIKNQNQHLQLNDLIIKAVCFLVFFSQISLQVYIKLNRQFYDQKLANLSQRINVGSAKGIYTNKELASKYAFELSKIEEALSIVNKDNKDFVSINSNPVVYLDVSLQYNTCTTWTFGYTKDELNGTLLNYFKLHNNKYPDIILVEDKDSVLDFVKNSNYKLAYEEDILLFEKQ